jgi:hypothetical protein
LNKTIHWKISVGRLICTGICWILICWPWTCGVTHVWRLML